MVTFENKPTSLNKISEALENNLNIIPSDSSISTIVNKISDSRYTFKLMDETGTLPMLTERTSLFYKNWLYICGFHASGCELIIVDINTMEIVKQVSLSTVSGYVPLIILRDNTYYYVGFGGGGSHILKGLLDTGEIVSTTNRGFVDRGMCLDDNYLYTIASNGIIRKIDKITLTIVQSSSVIYNSPLDIKCVGDFLYITGVGASPNTGAIVKIAKSDINTIVTTSSNLYNNEVTWRLLIDGNYVYAASATGKVKKWLLSDLSYVSVFFTINGNNLIYTIKKAMNNIWIGDSLGSTYRVDENGVLLSKLQTSNSANFVLEIDESNQILYRNANDDATITKYQIIDNLQNNVSDTVIKTTDLVTLNTEGAWVDTVYTLNGMGMTCNTLSNGYLRQLSFTGTTTADSAFVLAVPNVTNKLTPNTSYILNGVKSTDSFSTVFIRLTQYQNPDGSGLTKVTEKEAGDFKVFIAANDDYIYYKIEIVIKSGVTLSNSLYNNVPSMVPSSITYEQGEGPYLIKDLSTITDTIYCYKMAIIDGRLFVLPYTLSAGTIEVRDYQSNALLKTINDGANVATLGICFDNDYIYMSKTIETITGKKYRDVYIRKYNRCNLELVLESPIIYGIITEKSATNSSNIFSIVENEEFLYLACVQSTLIEGENHHIRKIRKSDFSLVTRREWHIPLFITKHTSGLFISGQNTTIGDPKYRRVDFLDWDLNVIQTFPQTTLTIANFRYSVYKDDYLFVCNDSGVLVKYQISTNTIIAEVQTSEPAAIRNMILINNDFLLLQTNTSKIMLYDLNLNFIKMWDFYNTTTTGGCVINDNNNTIWTQSASQPTTIFKKQLIDLTKGVI